MYTYRKNLPNDIHWGDVVNVVVSEIRDFGVFFTYKGVHGFLDWIRLPNKDDYKRFVGGDIQPGDEYRIRLGIVDRINNGTIKLVSSPDIQEIVTFKKGYHLLKEKLNVLQKCIVKGVNLAESGFFTYRIIADGSTLESELALICYCTGEEKEYLLQILSKNNYINFESIEVPVIISHFDDQLLKVYVRMDWLGIFENIKPNMLSV